MNNNINNDISDKNTYFKDSNFGPEYDATYDGDTNLETLLVCKRYKRDYLNTIIDEDEYNKYEGMNDNNNSNDISTSKCCNVFNVVS